MAGQALCGRGFGDERTGLGAVHGVSAGCFGDGEQGDPGATTRLMQGREKYGLHGLNQDGTVFVNKERILSVNKRNLAKVEILRERPEREANKETEKKL